jgi:hypothetical protein
MKSADYEGKSIREIEKQINSEKSGHNWQVVITRFLPGLLLVLLGYGLAGLNWHSQMDRLNADNTSLKIENGILREENASLQKQLTDWQTTDKLTSIIYHDIKRHDTLGSISVKYYGTDGYASELAKLNGLTVRTTLQVGQIIKVPRKPEASWKA